MENEGFPGDSDGKESACNVGDLGYVPGSEKSHEGHGKPLQYYCLENSVDGGAWGAAIHGVAKIQTLTNKDLDRLTNTHAHGRWSREIP